MRRELLALALKMLSRFFKVSGTGHPESQEHAGRSSLYGHGTACALPPFTQNHDNDFKRSHTTARGVIYAQPSKASEPGWKEPE